MYSMIPCHAMNPDCGKFQGKKWQFPQQKCWGMRNEQEGEEKEK